MKVLKFSIGFGPKLINKKKGETEYALRAIPLGGFVQLEGEDEASDDSRSFSKKPIWQRFLVLIAGVTVNILLALFIYLCIYMNINAYVTPRISAESDDATVKKYGFSVGDEIYKIDGTKVYNSDDITRIVQKSKDDLIEFELFDANHKKYKKEITIEPTLEGYVGVVFEDTKIYDVLENGAGHKAGLKAGDKLLRLEGESGDIYYYLSIIKANPDKELDLVVERAGQEVNIKLTPSAKQNRFLDLKYIEVKDLDFFHNMYYAWKETKYYLRATFIGIAEIFTGTAENVEVQGIVGISSNISKTRSLTEFFYYMSAISLSLGIMNLLPIPGLDGGKLLFLIIELFRGKPVSKETEAKITLIGFMLLLLLVVVITMKDISKLL